MVVLMRVVLIVCKVMGKDSESILEHGQWFKRGI